MKNKLKLTHYANNNNYKGNIKIFAIDDKYIKQGKKEELLKELRLDTNSIANRIKENME